MHTFEKNRNDKSRGSRRRGEKIGEETKRITGQRTGKNGMGYNLNSEIYVIDYIDTAIISSFCMLYGKKLTILLMMHAVELL